MTYDLSKHRGDEAINTLTYISSITYVEVKKKYKWHHKMKKQHERCASALELGAEGQRAI